jgi:tRNA(fMet)-specific endonuclease VapC
MNILDTDVLSHLQKEDAVGAAIQIRMDASPDQDFRITAVSVYEMIGGAADVIDKRKRQRRDLIPAFELIHQLFEYLGRWRGRVHTYDAASEQVYKGFTPRLTQELKDDARIAAIAISRGAAVWTCNVTDYLRVPGLTVFRAETRGQGFLTD